MSATTQPGGAGESYGRALLQRMGWSAGTGLGARRDGIVDPLTAKRKEENLGVGAQRVRPFADAWWDKAMEDAYGGTASIDKDTLLEACEGRRCRPGGGAKLARVAEADRILAGGGRAVGEGGNEADKAGMAGKTERRRRNEERKVRNADKARRRTIQKVRRKEKRERREQEKKGKRW